MGNYPRPHWFLVRPDNTITPLIAVDELPSNIRIVGIPAAMSLIDTKSMESVGVRERSTGTYDVQGIPAAISAHNRSNLDGQSQTSGKSGSDLALQRSASTSEVRTEEESVNGMKGALDKLPQSEPLQPPDVKPAQAEGQKTSMTAFRHLQNEEAANVEKWRQDVETPDDTQAKIDAVIAANETTPEEPNSNSKDENPRAARARAGLVPGCLFKHEMPDDATLRAIGIRALPSWYIAAHPEKARKRGWGSGSRTGGPSFRSSTWKTSTTPFSVPSSRSFPMPLPAQLPSFQPPSSFGLSAKAGPSLLRPQLPYPHTFTQAPITSKADQHYAFPRVQELSDHQYQQWQDGTLDRSNGLQLVQKPRSPGYKTFPFPVPVPLAPPAPETTHTEPKPLWPPRQSKFTKVSDNEDLTPNPKEKDAETSGRESAIKVEGAATKHSLSGVSTHDKEPRLSNVQAATNLPSLRGDEDHTAILKASTSHPIGKSNGFAPLVPSAAPESVPPDLSARGGQTNSPSTPFDQAPGQQKAPRQMFRRSAREGRALGSKSLEQSNQASAVFKQEDKEVEQKEAIASREHCHVRADKMFGRKDLKEDNKKKLSCSPEGKPKAKRAVKGRAPSVEPLLDFED
ncbi:MAG: hypothetical protein Q9205_000010 [Flavoplaca limonia]